MKLDIEIHCTKQKQTTGRETIDIEPDDTSLTIGDSQLFVCQPCRDDYIEIKLERTEYVKLKFH